MFLAFEVYLVLDDQIEAVLALHAGTDSAAAFAVVDVALVAVGVLHEVAFVAALAVVSSSVAEQAAVFTLFANEGLFAR